MIPGVGAIRAPLGQSVPAGSVYAAAWAADFAAEPPVFVAASAAMVVTAGPTTDAIGWRPADGAPAWSATGARASVPPIIGDDLVFLIHGRTLRAFHAVAGAEAWRAMLRGDAVAAPAWIAGALVVPTAAGIEAFRTNGTAVWHVPMPGIATRPVLHDGVVYVGLEAPAVVALTLADGMERWRRALPATPGPLAVVGGASLVFGVSDGAWMAYALDGQRRWAYAPRQAAIGAAAADDRFIYLAMFDNTIQAFDRQSGNRRWVEALDDRPVSGPMPSGGELLVPTSAGSVLAVDVTQGEHPVRRAFQVADDLTGAAYESAALGPAGTLYLIVSAQEEPGFRLHAIARGRTGQ